MFVPMDGEDQQTEIPPSFLALYADARQRLREPLAVVRQRYELCEDLAQLLTGQALALSQGGSVGDQEVLQRCLAGLRSADSGLSGDEAGWTVQRLAELLGWGWIETGTRAD